MLKLYENPAVCVNRSAMVIGLFKRSKAPPGLIIFNDFKDGMNSCAIEFKCILFFSISLMQAIETMGLVIENIR